MANHELQEKSTEQSEQKDWLGDNVPEFAGAKHENGYQQNQEAPKDYVVEKVPQNPMEALRNKELLNKIAAEYSEQYESNGKTSARMLAVKEWLDYYVAGQLQGPNAEIFARSEEFRNYSEVTMRIASDRHFDTSRGPLYPELSLNPLLKNPKTREMIVRSVNPQHAENGLRIIEQHMHNYEVAMSSIDKRLERGDKLSQKQLDVLGDYVYLGHNYADGRAQKLAEYCINEIDENTNNKASVPVIGALANYFAKCYEGDDEVRRRSRIFIADFQAQPGDMHTGVSTNYGCILEKKQFLQMSMTSEESMSKSRTNKSNDLYHLMMVTYHETTHDHQKYSLARGEVTPGAMAYAVNQVLRKDQGCIPVVNLKTGEQMMAGYYEANHDSDEIEIDADEEAWRQCRKFLVDHCKAYGERRHSDQIVAKFWRLRDQCKANEEEVRARRAFTRKKNSRGELVDPVYYDVETLAQKIRENPSLLQEYKLFGKYFGANGRLRPSLLTDGKIASIEYSGFDEHTDNVGAEIGTYIVREEDEVSAVVDNLRDRKLSEKEVGHLMGNLWNIVHQDILKIRQLKTVNFDNYDETRSRRNQSPQEIRDSLLEEHMRKVYNCMKIAEVARRYNPESSAYIEEQETKYIASYYREMSRQAKMKPSYAAMVERTYRKTGNKALVAIADMIRADYNL